MARFTAHSQNELADKRAREQEIRERERESKRELSKRK
jgi:hypothetical protein